METMFLNSRYRNEFKNKFLECVFDPRFNGVLAIKTYRCFTSIKGVQSHRD